MAKYRAQSTLKSVISVYKGRDGGEAHSSLWPLLNPSTAPQKKAGEVPGTFFHFERLG